MTATTKQYALVDLFTGEIVGERADKPKRRIRSADPIFCAMADICKMTPERDVDGHPKWTAMTDIERGQLNRFSKQVKVAELARSREATNEDIAEWVTAFGPWFAQNDWRGKERHQHPKPADVAELWTKYRSNGNGKTGVAQSWTKAKGWCQTCCMNPCSCGERDIEAEWQEFVNRDQPKSTQ